MESNILVRLVFERAQVDQIFPFKNITEVRDFVHEVLIFLSEIGVFEFPDNETALDYSNRMVRDFILNGRARYQANYVILEIFSRR